PPGRVTLLGDAIHAPPPVFAAGANAALRDAAHLADALVRVATGQQDALAAIGGYEAEMREYVRPILRVAAELWPAAELFR
ncbi:MAG TPA: FAD-dependent monooxygenase, partial [Micromonosporaceae bacterium]|nr:FAD-dependent monooxygenase [Micromonosporaceae bacterium]